MNSVERQMLDLVVEMSSRLNDVVEQLVEKVAELEERLDSSAVILASAYVDGAVSKLLISELFADLAGGDREKLDELLANSTALAEATTAQSEEDGSRQIQAALNEIVEASERAFDRRRLLR